MNVGLPGMKPFSMERMALSRPEIPAAGSECPMLLLICREEWISKFTILIESNFRHEHIHGYIQIQYALDGQLGETL